MRSGSKAVNSLECRSFIKAWMVVEVHNSNHHDHDADLGAEVFDLLDEAFWSASVTQSQSHEPRC